MATRKGRPPKFGDDLCKVILDNLRLGCSRTTSAELAGIDRDTLRVWCETYPAFSADVKKAIASVKRSASATVRQAVLNGDVSAAFRYLGYQERDEWADTAPTVNVNHSGSIGHRDLSAFTNEQIEALASIAEQVVAGELVP